MSDQNYVLFPRGLQFLNQAHQYVSFGKPRLLDSQTHFIPIYWKGPIENESKPKYRHIFFDTERISTLNIYYQEDDDWIIETDFSKQNDRDLLYFIQSLEDYIIEKITENSLEWFHKRITRSQIEYAFRPLVVVSRRSHLPIIRWHIPCEEGAPKIELTNQFRRKMYPHQVHPGMDVDIRFHLAGIQFNQNYCTPVVNVSAVRMYSIRSGNKTQLLKPILPERINDVVLADVVEDHEEIIDVKNGEYVANIVSTPESEKEEIEQLVENIVIQDEETPVQEETPMQEETIEQEQEVVMQKEDIKEEVVEPKVVEEVIVEQEVEPIKVKEEERVKKEKPKKRKRVFRTQKGERIWELY